MCDGWTCIPGKLFSWPILHDSGNGPGTNEIWVDMPCGITIHSKDVGVCDAIQSNLYINTDTLRKASAMCDCIPRVTALLQSGALLQTSADSGVSSATSGILEVFSQLQQVVLEYYLALKLILTFYSASWITPSAYKIIDAICSLRGIYQLKRGLLLSQLPR